MTKLTPQALELHELLIQALLAKIKAGEATSSDLNVARQFLKDNGVDYLMVKTDTPLHTLSEALPFSDPIPERQQQA